MVVSSWRRWSSLISTPDPLRDPWDRFGPGDFFSERPIESPFLVASGGPIGPMKKAPGAEGSPGAFPLRVGSQTCRYERMTKTQLFSRGLLSQRKTCPLIR